MQQNATTQRRKRAPWTPADDDPRSEKIRAVALELVAKKGYDAVSIDEIVAHVNVSKSTVYRRWSSKAELIVDAVRRNSRQTEDPGDTGSLRGDLIALLSVVDRVCRRIQARRAEAECVLRIAAASRASLPPVPSAPALADVALRGGVG